MKAKLIEALRTKFEGVQDAILGRVADKLISGGKVKSEGDIANAVAGVTFQQVLENYGDSRADEAQKSAVKNYENKYKIKDGQPISNDNEAKGQSGSDAEGSGAAATVTNTVAGSTQDAMQAMLQQVLDGQKRINDRLDGIDREKTTNSRQAQLTEILKNAPQSVRSRYEKDFARMTFKDDDEFGSWLAELTPDIEQMSVDLTAKGGIVGRPKGGAHGGGKVDDPNPYVKARAEAREKSTAATPAIQGLTL
ncbi:hypothetical protein [Paramuribaculum intestinale]|uniref:hypothetical protein n=1 Tax=Paramuribaculum intestinale TaxID=2094151 RepID=UPI0025A9875D|nr:hypothetical protein [Paramuribaculum intestinale]